MGTKLRDQTATGQFHLGQINDSRVVESVAEALDYKR